MKYTDFAYEMVKKKKRTFKEIVDVMLKKGLLTEDKIGYLYSDLMLDNRLFCTQDNYFDLREKYTWDQTHNRVQILEDDEEEEESYDEEENTS